VCEGCSRSSAAEQSDEVTVGVGERGGPAQAAATVMDGVRFGAWRILVGEEAKMLDEQVRANPEAPFNYDNYAEMYGPLIAQAQAEASGTPEP